MCNCKKNADYTFWSCDVCVLVFNDPTPKPVRYCRVCRAYICDACWGNWQARALASVRRAWYRWTG